jgi:hypothetical protein
MDQSMDEYGAGFAYLWIRIGTFSDDMITTGISFNADVSCKEKKAKHPRR